MKFNIFEPAVFAPELALSLPEKSSPVTNGRLVLLNVRL